MPELDLLLNISVAAVLSFGLGVLATLIAQATTRRHRLEDERRERSSEKLQMVRDWMESYRRLFQCKYPDILELVFAHKYLAPFYLPANKGEILRSSHIYVALQEYQEAVAAYDIAKKLGIRALKTLGPITGGWTRRLIFFRRPPYFRIAPLEVFSPPTGFEFLSDKLQSLYEHKEYIFEEFPQKFSRRIQWDKLDDTEPEDVGSLIMTRFPQKKYPPPPRGMAMETTEDVGDGLMRSPEELQDEIMAYWKNYWNADTWSKDEINLIDSFEYVSGRKKSAIVDVERALDELERIEDALLL